METINMNKRFMLIKIVSIMFFLVAVHAQEFFPYDFSSSSEEPSLLSQSEFPDQVYKDTNLPLQTQQFPHSEEPSLLSESEFPYVSEDSNVPVADQNLPLVPSHSEAETSSFSSEPEFPEDDTEDINQPQETEYRHSELPSPPKFSSPLPSEPPAPSPPETPLPKEPQPPVSPRPPWGPGNACKTKCATKCMRRKVPILHNLCTKVCRKRCIVSYTQLIYNCTNHCAESMPKVFKSDKKKIEGYVKYCFQKCIKIF